MILPQLHQQGVTIYKCKDSCRSCTTAPIESEAIKIAKEFLVGKINPIGIDLGAHAGLYGACLQPYLLQLYSFEIEKKSLNVLQKNSLLYPCIIPYKLAAWDTNEIKKTYTYTTHQTDRSAGGLLIDQNALKEQLIYQDTIIAVKLDDIFNYDINFNFIKMDIEGAETNALRGMSNILDKQTDGCLLVIEFCHEHFITYNNDIEEFFDILKNSKFRPMNFEYDRLKKLQQKDICNILLFKE